MFKRWVRYLPYAFVVWMAKRKLERWSPIEGWSAVEPFRNESITWKEPRP